MDLWSPKRSKKELSKQPSSSKRSQRLKSANTSCRVVQSGETGFTLIEVTLAILLLSGAMVILLGLQSAVMRRTYIDSQNQLAMMAARQVLSAIEASDLPVDTQETSGTLKEVLSGIIEINAEDQKSLQIFDELRVDLSVTFWGIPTVDDQAMKRVELTVSWSENPQDSLDVTYFIPNDEEATGEDSDPTETDGDS